MLTFLKIYSRKWKPSKFVDSTLVPLVVFGDGMKQKDAVRMKKRLSGVTKILYKEIICRQKQNLAAIVDINEFRTSVVRYFSLFLFNSCLKITCIYYRRVTCVKVKKK